MTQCTKCNAVGPVFPVWRDEGAPRHSLCVSCAEGAGSSFEERACDVCGNHALCLFMNFGEYQAHACGDCAEGVRHEMPEHFGEDSLDDEDEEASAGEDRALVAQPAPPMPPEYEAVDGMSNAIDGRCMKWVDIFWCDDDEDVPRGEWRLVIWEEPEIVSMHSHGRIDVTSDAIDTGALGSWEGTGVAVTPDILRQASEWVQSDATVGDFD